MQMSSQTAGEPLVPDAVPADAQRVGSRDHRTGRGNAAHLDGIHIQADGRGQSVQVTVTCVQVLERSALDATTPNWIPPIVTIARRWRTPSPMIRST